MTVESTRKLVWLAAAMMAGVAVVSWVNRSSRESARAAEVLPSIGNTKEFEQRVLGAKGAVLVDCYATWCVPCQKLAPTLAALASEYKGKASFFRVDVDQASRLADRLGVEKIPTVLVFAGGAEVARIEAMQKADVYRAALDQAMKIPTSSSAPASGAIEWDHDKGEQMTTTAARTVTMHGQALELTGNPIAVGSKAPDFVAVDNNLNEVHFNDLPGKAFVISAVPSLDTPVCDRETRRFNVEAGKLGKDVQVLTISMDLPFAQARWCAAAGVENVKTLSDYRYAAFGSAYGVLIQGLRLESRCVFVVGPDRRVTYIQQVGEITNEPNYDEVLAEVAKVAK